MRWLVLKEGLRGIEFHDRPGTPAWGDGESCLGGARCSRSASGGQQLPTDGHTNLRGRGVLPRLWPVLKEGLRGVAVPNGPGTTARGNGSPPEALVGAQARHGGDNSSQPPGHTSLGGRGVLPRRWLVLKECVHGQQLPTARAYKPRGTGSATHAVVGAQGGLAGGSSFHRPGHTGLGRRGVLPRWWSVLKDGLRGVAISNILGTLASGDGESCPSEGWCSRKACGGQ